MKKIQYLLTIGAIATMMSCKQEAAMPTEAEMNQKVQDKYGAELETLKELKKMECEEKMPQQVSERLATGSK